MNPLLAMPQVSGKYSTDTSSMFIPNVMSNYDSMIEKMEAISNTVYDDVLLQDIITFRGAVKVGNTPLAMSAIIRIYAYKIALVKILIETAIDHIPVSEVGVVNTIVALSDINMDSITCVMVVELLCTSKRTRELYTQIPQDTYQSINHMILSAGDRCNIHYEKLRYCNPTYWTYPLYLARHAVKGAGHMYDSVPDITRTDENWARKLDSAAI